MFERGLFGMGGYGGFTPPMPDKIAGFMSPKEMRRAQIKNALLGMGTNMLAQGPSRMPIGLGTSFGQGLQAGMSAAQQAGADYQDAAYKAYGMDQARNERDYQRQQDAQKWEDQKNRDGINDAWRNQEQRHQQQQWAEEAAKKKQWDDYLGTLPADQQGMARTFPEVYARQSAEKMFNTSGGAGGAKGIYGNIVWGADGKPYGLSKDGSGLRALPVEGGATVMDPYASSYSKAKGSEQGKRFGETEFDLEKARSNVTADLDRIDEIIKHPGLKASTGTWQGSKVGQAVGPYFDNDVADFNSRIAQLKGGAFLQAYQTLKGGGAIANAEGQKAEAAIARLNQAVSEADFVQALQDYQDAIERGFNSMAQQVNAVPYQRGGNRNSSGTTAGGIKWSIVK